MGSRTVLCCLLLLATAGAKTPVTASNDPAQFCIDATHRAAQQTGVPVAVLLAVSVVETGRNHRPWPWTVNDGGNGHWLDSAKEAEALAQTILDQGTTNVDLGCFQLNYRWHAQAFPSIADMLEPDRNALYAAEHLARLYDRTGDWPLAAAAYHSSTPEHADRYRARFEAAFATLEGASLPPAKTRGRTNGFPLLTGGEGGRNGSLVPGTSGARRLIGGT